MEIMNEDQHKDLPDFLIRVNAHPFCSRIEEGRKYTFNEIEECKKIYIQILEKLCDAFNMIINRLPEYEQNIFITFFALKEKLKNVSEQEENLRDNELSPESMMILDSIDDMTMETLHIHTDNGADENKNCPRVVQMSTVSESTVNEATINNSENDIPNESPNTDRRKSCFEFKIPSHPSVFMTRCYTLEFIRNTNLKITDAEEAKASILSSSVTVESTKQNTDFANGDHLLKEDSNCKSNAVNPNSTSNDSDIICLDDLINETHCRAEWFEDDFGEEIARNDAITGEFDGYDYPHSIPILESLNEKFGLESFRENQMQVINVTLSRHDSFVLVPTGGGKSLCYQLPAILTPGVTIVVSPLKSLILDQVDKLKSLDIPSAHLTGDVTEARSYEIYKDLERLEPIIKLLYMTSRFDRTTY